MSLINDTITVNVSKALTCFADRLQKELRNIVLNAMSEYTTYNGSIYHYTSASVVPMILHTSENKMCLRFTDYRFLNDESEGKEIDTFFKQCLENMLKQNQITREFFDEAHRQRKLAVRDTSNFFVTCFSQDKDSLPMWNYYLKDGRYEGYSLGFDFNFQEYLGSKSIIKRKVIYDDEIKKKFISHLINEAVSSNLDITIEDRCKQLMKSIHELTLVMKKSCFSHENEVRLILDLDLAKQQCIGVEQVSDEVICFHCNEVKHYDKNGVFIPYCDVTWDNKTVLKEICYAPTMNPEQTELGIKFLLQSFGYDESKIAVGKSEVPVRY